MSQASERGILREARDERETRDEGRRKKYSGALFFFSSPRPTFRASRKMSRFPLLAHKAPVMQAIICAKF